MLDRSAIAADRSERTGVQSRLDQHGQRRTPVGGRPGWPVWNPHGHDKYEKHADRGARACFPAAGAEVPPSVGKRGMGRYRGGEGIERDLEVLENVTVSLITERRVFPPWGLEGGGPGAVGENWLLPAGDEDRAQRLGDKCSFELKAGDVLRMLTPGGGGWGSAAT